jgi:hypothetical protein
MDMRRNQRIGRAEPAAGRAGPRAVDAREIFAPTPSDYRRRQLALFRLRRRLEATLSNRLSMDQAIRMLIFAGVLMRGQK